MLAYGIVVALACIGLARAELIGTIVFPHGGSILDPTQATTPEGLAAAEALSTGAIHTGQDALASKPELVVIITPHGFNDEQNIILYGNPTAHGGWSRFRASLHIDTETTHELSSYLNQHGFPTRLLHSNDPNEPVLLQWGEVIPWVLLGSPADTPAVIISMPTKWYNQTSQQAPELQRFGKLLRTFLQAADQPRTLVIASADLAHTHDCQHETFGCSPHAKPFEDAVQQWVKTQSLEPLLAGAGSHEQQAQTCGYAQFLIIHGLLKAIEAEHGAAATGEVVAHGVPSYFGMMVAKWDMPQNSSTSSSSSSSSAGVAGASSSFLHHDGSIAVAGAAGPAELDDWSLLEHYYDGDDEDVEGGLLGLKHWRHADAEELGHYADHNLDLSVHYEDEGMLDDEVHSHVAGYVPLPAGVAPNKEMVLIKDTQDSFSLS